MSENKQKKLTVEIPFGIWLAAKGLMAPHGLSFQGLLSRLLEVWGNKNQNNKSTTDVSDTLPVNLATSSQAKETKAFDACLAANPELAKAFLVSLQMAIERTSKVVKNAESSRMEAAASSKGKRSSSIG